MGGEIGARAQAGAGLFRAASARRTGRRASRRSRRWRDLRPKLTEQEVRTQLGGFGFSADKAQTKVGNLSGGERARLMLALATLDKPNLLILDEPTNHLDIDARNELLTALNDFDGAVVLVSHDRRLIEATADRLLLVANGKVKPFEGDLDDYRRFLLSRRQCATRRRAEPEAEAHQGRTRAATAAERRRQLKPLKDKVDAAEHQIADADRPKSPSWIAALSDPLAVHQGSRERQRGLQEARRCRAQAGRGRSDAGCPPMRNTRNAMAVE